MQTERTRVLELVAAGTISVEQATQLLDAIGWGSAEAPSPAPKVETRGAAGRSLGALVPGLTAQELIELADHGVGADYLRELREAGLTDLSVSELTELFDHGVRARLRSGEMRDAGFAHLSAAELTELFDHGVQPDYVREMERRAPAARRRRSGRRARAKVGGGSGRPPPAMASRPASRRAPPSILCPRATPSAAGS